ncbi:MAG TPA: DUF2092 domain-containing protein, partial [Planctomycetota bacterium]|nr:DUF2092 domain-containing protein [Planctomycetota bacterium]
MKRLLLLSLCVLEPQDPTAEAKKLLDALAPTGKDPVYSQIEWESGSKHGAGYFSRQKAWRVDTKNGDVELFFIWDGKGYLNYMKKSNRFFRNPKDAPSVLLSEGGALAEIFFSGNADRLFNGNKATLKKEKLDDVDCSHITIPRPDLVGSTKAELHLWIDADKHCRRYTYRNEAQGKPYERTFNYRVVDAPTTTAETFDFRVPADAKDLKGG